MAYTADRYCGLLCCTGCLGPFLQSCFPTGQPPHCTVSRVIPPQVQEFAIPSVDLPNIPVTLFLQLVEFLLNGNTTIWSVSHFSQFCIFCLASNLTLCCWLQPFQAIVFSPPHYPLKGYGKLLINLLKLT